LKNASEHRGHKLPTLAVVHLTSPIEKHFCTQV